MTFVEDGKNLCIELVSQTSLGDETNSTHLHFVLDGFGGEWLESAEGCGEATNEVAHFITRILRKLGIKYDV